MKVSLLDAVFGSVTAPRAARIVIFAVLTASWTTMVQTSCAAGPAAPSAAKLERITQFFDNEVATGKLPGAVILIQQHGKPVYLKCFGVQDVATKAPMTPDTIFALHSMTKPVTSVAAMMLIDEGKLSLRRVSSCSAISSSFLTGVGSIPLNSRDTKTPAIYHGRYIKVTGYHEIWANGREAKNVTCACCY
jgi:hypothetical protein